MVETLIDPERDAQKPETVGEASHETLAPQAEQGEKDRQPAEKITERTEEEAKAEIEAARPVESEITKQSLAATDQTQPTLPRVLSKAEVRQAMRTYLGQVRHHMNGIDKAFSEFIHNPGVDAMSELTGKTLIRPSGILLGGLATLAGSAWYLYATNHTGYHYNFVFAFLLFVGGFILGIFVEMLYKLFTKGRKP